MEGEMLAAIARDTSGNLTLERIPIPHPKNGEALIRVLGSGVCHSDLHVIKDEVKFPRPAVLGHEVMGQVIEKLDFEGIYPEVNEGNLVVSCFIMPCRNCEYCLSGKSNICSEFFKHNRLNGNMLDGTKRLSDHRGEELASYSMAGFAEFAVVPLSALAVIPDDSVGPEWCVLGCAGVTAYSAVRRAIRSRETTGADSDSVTVVGIGGVGMFIVLFASLLGVKTIVAIDLDQRKLELAASLGATHLFNASYEDLIPFKKSLPNLGTHLVFEAVGTAKTIEVAMELVLEGGLVTVVGIAPHGTRAAIEITPLVRREYTLKGSFGGRPEQDLHEVIDLATKGKIPLSTLVTEKFLLNEVNEAFTKLSSRQTLGRSIISFEKVE